MVHYTKPEYYSITYWNNNKKRDNSIKNCTTKSMICFLNEIFFKKATIFKMTIFN